MLTSSCSKFSLSKIFTRIKNTKRILVCVGLCTLIQWVRASEKTFTVSMRKRANKNPPQQCKLQVKVEKGQANAYRSFHPILRDPTIEWRKITKIEYESKRILRNVRFVLSFEDMPLPREWTPSKIRRLNQGVKIVDPESSSVASRDHLSPTRESKVGGVWN